MNDNLPFKNCNDKEFKKLFCVKANSLKTSQETMTARKILAQNLPFFNCSDYAMLTACLSNKDKLLEMYENNSFTTDCHSLIDGLTMESFSCKYYNEDKFNSMLPNHQEKSLKIFHLNIRSLNKHCHELEAFLSCLNCKFDVLLLTEIGNTNKELIENVFDNYNFYYEHSIYKKGGAGLLIKKRKI